MTTVYEREFRWNEDVIHFDKRLLACMYGQHTIGDRGEKQVIFDLDIIDDRFPEEDDLPWDAYGELEGPDLLRLSGASGPGGQGPAKQIVLPADVLCRLTIWTQED